MDFLKELAISDEVIEKVILNNSRQCLFNLECNQEECVKIIRFIRNIGIKNVDELLIQMPEIFIQPLNIFMKKLARYDIVKVINDVNNDSLLMEKYLEPLVEA